MKNLLVVISLLFLWVPCKAQSKLNGSLFRQDFEYGVNGSLGVRFEKLGNGIDFQPVFESGLFFNMVSGPNWRFGVEFNYILIGFHASQSQFINSANPYYRYIYIDRIHMLGMPIGMYRNLGNKGSAGMGYAFNHISGFRKIEEKWSYSPEEQPGLDMRKLDLGLFVDLQYFVSPSIAIKVRYRHGIVSVVHYADDRFNRWVSMGLMYSVNPNSKR